MKTRLIAGLLALLAACSSTEPRAVRQTWILDRLDNAPPPFLYNALPADSFWVNSGVIVVYEGGEWEAIFQTRRKLNGIVTIDTAQYTGSYQFTGATVNADQFLFTATLPGGGTHQMDVFDTGANLQVSAGLWASSELYLPAP